MKGHEALVADSVENLAISGLAWLIQQARVVEVTADEQAEAPGIEPRRASLEPFAHHRVGCGARQMREGRDEPAGDWQRAWMDENTVRSVVPMASRARLRGCVRFERRVAIRPLGRGLVP